MTDDLVKKFMKERGIEKATPAQQRAIIAFIAQKQNRMAQTKKLADNITKVSKGESAITDIFSFNVLTKNTFTKKVKKRYG